MKLRKIVEQEPAQVCEHNEYCFIRREYGIEKCSGELDCKQIKIYYNRYKESLNHIGE